MDGARKVLGIMLACGLVAGAAAHLAAGQVIHHPRPYSPLAERVDWAFQEARKAGFRNGFWIGFSIRRLMGERSFIGSYFDGSSGRNLSLEEIIYGKKTAVEKKISGEQTVREAAEHALSSADRGQPERTVVKDIAFLMKFGSVTANLPERVCFSNLSLPVSLQGLTLLWLGPAVDEDSLTLLTQYYGKSAKDQIKKNLLHAVSLHRNPTVVVPFLERVLKSRESVEIRAEAAALLGEQNDGRALDILTRTVKTDPSLEVKKNAIWGLIELDLPASVEVLADFARTYPEKEIRTEAVEGLAEKATKQAVGTLAQVAFNDKDTEVQKHAVEALADLPLKQGLPNLIRVAKTHANKEVRKAAIYALGDMKDPVAIQALVDIVKGKF